MLQTLFRVENCQGYHIPVANTISTLKSRMLVPIGGKSKIASCTIAPSSQCTTTEIHLPVIETHYQLQEEVVRSVAPLSPLMKMVAI